MKKYYPFIIVLTFLIALAMPFVSAAHYVVGIVNEARDGASANGRSVVLWNPIVGINDNQTDIIGIGGNSGIDNVYMIDCELLSNSCSIGNILKVKVLDNGDGRTSYDASVTVTGAGYDVAPELTLNSFPNSSLISPTNHANMSSSDTVFNCSATDLDSNLDNVTLYGNWSGGWHANETISISGGSSYGVFTKQIPEGNYIWNCLVSDNLSLSTFSNNNFSFAIDRTPPVISSVLVNESYVCGTLSYIRVNCSANDNIAGVSNVIIQAIKPNGTINYSTQKISNIYYSEILANVEGVWRFNCIANDSVGNSANLTSMNFSVYSNNADLQISSEMISFSDYSPVETRPVSINANISNLGCGDAFNFLVGFYNGDPDFGGVQIENKTVSISKFNNGSTNISWIPSIGTSNIFVFADFNNSINETDESNNKANNTLTLGSWQKFFGNVSLNKLISDSSFFNMTVWNNASKVTGNIFMANKENVNWNNLAALGKNKTGGNSSDDFSNADILLGMSEFSDSIYKVYTMDGEIDKTDNFTVFNKNIPYVPVVNSTNNSNFITGILWDYTTDTNGYFDQSDKEPLVFITKVNIGKTGAYGTYDYEFKIPALLRSYNSTEGSVYLYYELV